jgi:hypothetical protein
MGIVLGEDEGLSEELQPSFRASGLSHLLRLSGRTPPRNCSRRGLQLDGELVALADDGRPDFHRLSSRICTAAPGSR